MKRKRLECCGNCEHLDKRINIPIQYSTVDRNRIFWLCRKDEVSEQKKFVLKSFWCPDWKNDDEFCSTCAEFKVWKLNGEERHLCRLESAVDPVSIVEREPEEWCEKWKKRRED
jgi:hypothetical protein